MPTTLDSSFAPFGFPDGTDKYICSGERHRDEDWVQVDDFRCTVPLLDKYVEDRYQIRFYDHDNLNYFRLFTTHHVDYFALDRSGTATASIRTDAKFVETFRRARR